MEASLQLCDVLSQEFILCAPCTRLEERMLDAIDALLADDVIAKVETNVGLEEERWSRRLAARLEEEELGGGDARPDPAAGLRYRVGRDAHALAERRRLLLTIRPLLEAYAATCRSVEGLEGAPQKQLVKDTLDQLTDDFTRNVMPYGEAVSTDAIRNCHRLLRQWGVLEMYEQSSTRCLRLRGDGAAPARLAAPAAFCPPSPLLAAAH